MKHGMIAFADINPSLLIGFLVESVQALEDLVQKLMACRASPVAFTEDLDEALCGQVMDLDEVMGK
jgi:hypothetical protein